MNGGRAEEDTREVGIGPSSPDLSRFGVYDQSSAQEDAFARVLLLGPAKLGKTTCLTLTAPDPLVLNCDGISATKGAAKQGAQFKALDCTNVATWKTNCVNAVEIAKLGGCRTIIVDTITLMQDAIIDDLTAKGLEGRDLWSEVLQLTLKGIKILKQAPAHLFVVAHMIPGTKDETEGILPLIAGQSAQRVPAMLHDNVLFVYDETRAGQEPVPHRFFACGPQGTWRYGGRHIKSSCQIPADVLELFDVMGITP